MYKRQVHLHGAEVGEPVPVVVVRTGGQGDRDFPGRIREAVSYTHLRAHETVLDLVCRLLLEKKKNLTSYIIHTNNKSAIPKQLTYTS